MSDVTIRQRDIDALMRDIDGPVGDLMRDIARQIGTVAREKVRIRGMRPSRPGMHRTGRTSNAKPPGYTKARITTTVGHSKLHDGLLFGGAEAPPPGLFLELPAEQMHEKYPFLTTGLWSVHVS